MTGKRLNRCLGLALLVCRISEIGKYLAEAASTFDDLHRSQLLHGLSIAVDLLPSCIPETL